MREILFRAINANDEFIYGLPYTDGTNDTVYFKEFSNRLCWRNEDGIHCNQPYKNGTLEQFIGLTDKNGVKIFEGDVSNHKSQDGRIMKGVIYFSEGCFKVKYGYASPMGDDRCDYFLSSMINAEIANELEIIGNIHEK